MVLEHEGRKPARPSGERISENRRAIEIDPDYVLVYLKWGGALHAKGQYEDAIKVNRQGLRTHLTTAWGWITTGEQQKGRQSICPAGPQTT
jgi:tetratricopeptide (TPR) repeat protein